MNPDNARTLRITAAAGTELAGAYSPRTLSRGRVPGVTPRKTRGMAGSGLLPLPNIPYCCLP